MNALDELIVPQPPYRMTRPQAVLAVAKEKSQTAEEKRQAVRAQEDREQEAREVDLKSADARAAGRPLESASLEDEAKRIRAGGEAATQTARASIEQTPPPNDATPQESQQYVEVQQETLGKIEEAAKLLQQKFAAKSPTEKKRQVTRDQTAAIKQDAVHDEQKMASPGGIEFHQSEETAAQKAGRIGREALEKLNAFKSLQEKKGTSPQELEFARQQADLSQKQAEAAQRGEKIPEDRVDMSKVDAAGAKPQEVNPDKSIRTKEQQEAVAGSVQKAREIAAQNVPAMTAEEAERKAAEARNAGKPLETAYQLDEAKRIREGKGATVLKVGDKTPAGEVIAINPDGKPKIRYTAPTADKAPTTDIGSQRVNMPETPDIKAAREAAEEELARRKAQGGVVATPDTTPATPAATEAAPVAPAQRVQQLENELKKMRADFEEYRNRREATGAARSPSTPEQELDSQNRQRPEGEGGGAARREGQRQGPGEGERSLDELGGIEQMGDTTEPGWLEKQGVRMEATKHDFWAYWWNIWAKRAKDSLSKRDKKIKVLEKKSKAFVEGSWLGTALNPLTYGARLVWQKWRKGLLEAAQVRHDARRVVHENSRNELLNDLMRRFRIPLRTHEAQGKEYAGESDNIDLELDMADSTLKELDLQIARERNPQRKAELLADRADVDELYREQTGRKRDREELWKESEKNSSRIQSVMNQIGKYASLPTSDTQPGERERLDTRQKRQPKQPKATAA